MDLIVVARRVDLGIVIGRTKILSCFKDGELDVGRR